MHPIKVPSTHDESARELLVWRKRNTALSDAAKSSGVNRTRDVARSNGLSAQAVLASVPDVIDAASDVSSARRQPTSVVRLLPKDESRSMLRSKALDEARKQAIGGVAIQSRL
jgi:hypothetical protein